MTYFVTYKLFNSENQGWAYKFELKTDDLTAAKRKYHDILKTYIGLAPYIFVCVSITDQYDNIIEKECWQKTETTEE